MRKKVPLSKVEIDKMILTATNHVDLVRKLYIKAIPEWDKVKSISGHPTISTNTALYIMNKLKAIPGDATQAGLLWMNKGFSNDANMPDWIIWNDKVKLQIENKQASQMPIKVHKAVGKTNE